MKQALTKQIVEAIDTTYLKSLRNVDMSTFNKEVLKILAYLFQRYGKVTPEKLQTMWPRGGGGGAGGRR